MTDFLMLYTVYNYTVSRTYFEKDNSMQVGPAEPLSALTRVLEYDRVFVWE
jgi:hypothetical protein